MKKFLLYLLFMFLLALVVLILLFDVSVGGERVYDDISANFEVTYKTNHSLVSSCNEGDCRVTPGEFRASSMIRDNESVEGIERMLRDSLDAGDKSIVFDVE